MLHRYSGHYLVFHLGLGQDIASGVAQRRSDDDLSQRCRLRTIAGRSFVEAPLAGFSGLLGLHLVGMRVSIRTGQSGACLGVLRDRRLLSFPGVLVFWLEPVLLGLDVFVSGDHLVRGAALRPNPGRLLNIRVLAVAGLDHFRAAMAQVREMVGDVGIEPTTPPV